MDSTVPFPFVSETKQRTHPYAQDTVLAPIPIPVTVRKNMTEFNVPFLFALERMQPIKLSVQVMDCAFLQTHASVTKDGSNRIAAFQHVMESKAILPKRA